MYAEARARAARPREERGAGSEERSEERGEERGEEREKKRGEERGEESGGDRGVGRGPLARAPRVRCLSALIRTRA